VRSAVTISLLRTRVRAYERRLIAEALQQANGIQSVAAGALGIPPGTLSKKLCRAPWLKYPDECWNDPPLAWAIRRDGDRVALGACWTREEIAAEAKQLGAGTIALVLDEGEARLLVKTIDTLIATGARRLIGSDADGACVVASAGARDEEHPGRVERGFEDVPV